MKAGNLTIYWRHNSNTTACLIKDEKGIYIGAGFAHCSLKDHFCRNVGRKVSLAKALNKIEMPKLERKVVWKLYRNMSPGGRW